MTKRPIPIMIFFLGITFLVGTVAAQESLSFLTAVSPAQWSVFVPDLTSKAHIPGLSVAVIRDGKIVWTGAFGVKSVATREPCDEETIFEAASLTKPLFAYLAMLYVADSKLDLDTPLINYLSGQIVVDSLLKHPIDKPGFRRDWFERITVRHVLSHSSGTPHGEPIDSVYPLLFEPGSKFRYSADGYYFLQLVLENMEGMPLEQIAQRRVLDPLGMTHSCLVWRDEYEQTAADGHNIFGDPQECRRRSRAHAGATLYTTATDYARFVCAVMNKTQLSAEQVAAMLTPQIDVNDFNSWCLGFGLQRDANGTAFWQTGDYGIFRNFIIAYGDSRCGVVWLTNSFHGLSIASDLVAQCLGGATHISGPNEYSSYNSPVERFAFLAIDEGVSTALARIAEFRAEDSSGLDEAELNYMGYELLNADRVDDALAFFELNAREHPQSGNAWDSFAEGQMKAGQLDTAIVYYRRSLQLDSTNQNAERYMEWIDVALEARDYPVKLSNEDLSKFVGQYGPRRVRLQNDTLYYVRAGSSNPERYLYPLKPNLFGIQNDSDWRLLFDLDEDGRPIALEGLHVSGFVDPYNRDE